MSSPRRAPSMDSDSNTRKRVCKACDRCRLKKSKCDGASPCSRCKQDNAICVFGERKKSHDKVYPKGYVEMLEQQQAQLVAGLRELYQRLQTGCGWPGSPLQEAQGGHPLTHDILERLGLLHSAGDGSSNYEGFEEDCSRLQRRLLSNGAACSRSRASTSSDCEPGFASSASSIETPPLQPLRFINPFLQNAAPPTPSMQSPIQPHSHLGRPIKEFPQLTMPSFPQTNLNPASLMRSQWATQAPSIDDGLDFFAYDTSVDINGPLSFNGLQSTTGSPLALMDFTSHEVDFSDFVPL